MNITEFEKKHNVRFISKDKSWLMRLIGFFSNTFTYNFWTTYRLPFQKPTITYPPDTKDPMALRYRSIREHELIHCKDMRSACGLFKIFWLFLLIPLPILFSGRWFIERYAYLHGIINYNHSIDRVINILWDSYGWIWPKSLMRRWFNRKLKEHKEGRK